MTITYLSCDIDVIFCEHHELLIDLNDFILISITDIITECVPYIICIHVDVKLTPLQTK